MPWTPADAQSKTQKAQTPKEQDTWSQVANKQLQKTEDEASAIKIANYVVGRMGGRYRNS